VIITYLGGKCKKSVNFQRTICHNLHCGRYDGYLARVYPRRNHAAFLLFHLLPAATFCIIGWQKMRFLIHYCYNVLEARYKNALIAICQQTVRQARAPGFTGALTACRAYTEGGKK
jgi:hypothetical protein